MRTIIELSPEQIGALGDVTKRLGISRAEAIRRAVELYTAQVGLADEGEADKAFGLWRDRAVDGLDYEDRVRADWDRHE